MKIDFEDGSVIELALGKSLNTSVMMTAINLRVPCQ